MLVFLCLFSFWFKHLVFCDRHFPPLLCFLPLLQVENYTLHLLSSSAANCILQMLENSRIWYRLMVSSQDICEIYIFWSHIPLCTVWYFPKQLFYVLKYKWLLNQVYQLSKLFQHICGASYFYSLWAKQNRSPLSSKWRCKVTAVKTKHRSKVLGFALQRAFYTATCLLLQRQQNSLDIWVLMTCNSQ